MKACMHGYFQVIACFLINNEIINNRDVNGFTPLMHGI